MTTDFVHLHVHTAYSLLDGAIKLDELFQKAERDGQKAVAITDHGNLHGAARFSLTAKNYPVKPIIGCEVYVSEGDHTNLSSGQPKPYHQVLLCENEIGFRNLLQIVNTAQLEGKTPGLFGRPRADRALLEKHSEGLIALSSCLSGMVPRAILEFGYDKALPVIDWYRQVYGDRFYLEIQENGIPEQTKANEAVLKLSREFDIPVVATCDAHFLERKHHTSHDILLCIQTGKSIHDEGRFKFSTDQVYFRTREEMAQVFRHVPEALTNTMEVAERCNFQIEKSEPIFPTYETPVGEDLNSTFTKTSRVGLKKRLQELKSSHDAKTDGPWKKVELEYAARLETEMELIREKGFAGYFLIVQDFIRWARDQGIPVGPGRGSAAGSLVSYSLRITNIDPIQYGLLFERFLNPERLDNPDIDVDFCAEGRDAVIQYVSDKYGEECVSQIASFGTMKARMVVRDVGRAMGYSFGEVDTVVRLIPTDLDMTLEKAEREPDLARLLSSSQWVQDMWPHCRALEGLLRHASTHAAGVVISEKPLGHIVPLMRDKDRKVVCQYDKNDVEKVGLIKFDFLGLKTLTVIDKCLKHIKAVSGIEIDMDTIPVDDPKPYELLGRGLSNGVFQFESSGMKELLVRIKPDCIEDLTAIAALYRPGPLGSGMVDQFIARKKGEEPVTYMLPELETILEPTYGMMVYQEQVQQIAHTIGGLSLGEADLLRRAMAKKSTDEMEFFSKKFQSGATAQGFPVKVSQELWNLMEKFAEYGFNKSHSAAYAMVAYHTAYLKAYHPAEFIAALMTMEKDDSDKIMAKIAECRDLDIEVLPPDVNESSLDFTVTPDGRIRFGLAAVKNVGEGAVLSILEARESRGPFKSLHDFCERVDLHKINRRVVESLVKCGAFDTIERNRATLLGAVEAALDGASRAQADREAGQTSLFGMMGDDEKIGAPQLPDVPPWSHEQELAFEKEVLGFFITGHPLDDFRNVAKAFATHDSVRLREETNERQARVAALITSFEKRTTRQGKPMASGMAEDQFSPFRFMMFSEGLEASAAALEDLEKPLLLFGKVDVREGGSGLLVDRMIPLEKAAEVCSNEVHFYLKSAGLMKSQMQRLFDLVKRHRGRCRGYIHLEIPDRPEALIQLPVTVGMQPSDQLVEETAAIFGPGVVTFQ
jgi:DNA polymerase III subunit alpha